MSFDVAAASARWEKTRRPVDLDPPPSRWVSNADTTLDLAAEPTRRPTPPPPPGIDTSRMTAAQKRKFVRNLGIVAGARSGISQRELARIYDLPHSRVAAILAEFRGYAVQNRSVANSPEVTPEPR